MGFGNIAGVATAVTTGGPGAVLWMWLTAFMGMLIKQVEVTLAVYYRRTDEEGNPYGGPTYYMEYGLGEERHWGKKWLPLAFVFGLGIFSTFFISASNFTTSEVLAQSFGIPQELASLLLVVFILSLIHIYNRRKNIITRALGIGREVEPDFFEVDLEGGDYILLCSDGLSNMLEDQSMYEIITGEGSLKEKAALLIERCV